MGVCASGRGGAGWIDDRGMSSAAEIGTQNARTRRAMTAEERALVGGVRSRWAWAEAGAALVVVPPLLAVFSGLVVFALPVGVFGLVNAAVGLVPRGFLKPYAFEMRVGAGVWVGLWYVVVLWLFAKDRVAARARGRTRDADLAAGAVEVVRYRVLSALCVTEDEHGALGYYVKTAEGDVVFVVDEASACEEEAEIAWGYMRYGRDPRQVRFGPREWLEVVRTAVSGRVLSAEFVGERVEPEAGIYTVSVEREWIGDGPAMMVQSTWAEVLAAYARADRAYRAPTPECEECGYAMDGAEIDASRRVRCPECGVERALDDESEERGARRTRRAA